MLRKLTTFDEAVKKTEVENLFVATSGPISPNPAELLSLVGMLSFITHVLKLFGNIIIDAPPILAVTDAQVLANLCDRTILVVESSVAKKEAAIQAKALILRVMLK